MAESNTRLYETYNTKKQKKVREETCVVNYICILHESSCSVKSPNQRNTINIMDLLKVMAACTILVGKARIIISVNTISIK